MTPEQEQITKMFSTVSDRDLEYATDLVDDLKEYAPIANWMDAEEMKIIAQWFRKARCEAVLDYAALTRPISENER